MKEILEKSKKWDTSRVNKQYLYHVSLMRLIQELKITFGSCWMWVWLSRELGAALQNGLECDFVPSSRPGYSLWAEVRVLPSFLAISKWLGGKESACQCRRYGLDLWISKIPWRRKWQPTPVFLPGKSHGQRSLAGYSLRGQKVEHSNTTKSSLQSPLHLIPYVYVNSFIPVQVRVTESNPQWWLAQKSGPTANNTVLLT